MDYKHWCKFLEPEILIKWETEIIIGERIGTINRDFNNMNLFQNLLSVFFISFNSLKKYGLR